MSNLQVKDAMSVYQLALVIMEAVLGIHMIVLAKSLVQTASQWAWISMLAGGCIYFAAAYMMLRLGQLFPGEELHEYMPRIWGKPVGRLLNWFLVLLFATELLLLLRIFTNVISFTMFDQTPQGVIVASMLAVCVYAALQSWGVILRIIQIVILGTKPFMLAVWFSILLNFHLDNVLPFQPENWWDVARGTALTWDAYSGYEIILLLLPMVRPGKVKIRTALVVAFALITTLYVLSLLMTVSVLSVETTKRLLFPTVTAVKAVRLPGLFIERLENFLVFFWIPTAFGTVVLLLYGAGKLAGATLAHHSHQAFVLFLVPPVFLGTMLLEDPSVLQMFSTFVNRSGLAYSFGVIPLTLLMAWRKRRPAQDEKTATLP